MFDSRVFRWPLRRKVMRTMDGKEKENGQRRVSSAGKYVYIHTIVIFEDSEIRRIVKNNMS